MENSSSNVGEYPLSPEQKTPEYHPGLEENDAEEEPSYHYTNCYYENGLPDYQQEPDAACYS